MNPEPKKSWKGDFHAFQMAFATRKVLEFAENQKSIADDAKIKLMQTGSGDPFGAAHNAREFVNILPLVDTRIKTIYSSTAGALRNLPEMISVANEAQDQEFAIRYDSQFSTHSFRESTPERKQLIPNPGTTSAEQVTAAKDFHKATGNKAYINYMVVPKPTGIFIILDQKGWNNEEFDADLIVQNMEDGLILKLVKYNDTSDKRLNLPHHLKDVKCTQRDVEIFAEMVRIKMIAAGKNFEIITPIDKAEIVGANCGRANADRHKQAAVPEYAVA